MDHPNAGFWKRLAAMIIDALILIVCASVAGLGLGALFYSFSGPSGFYMVRPQVRLLLFVAAWLYFALMESGPGQATLGKRAMGIRVTDVSGARISFMRATGRHFGKFVSGLILYIGFVMAAFTERKQGLHDIMAGCLVVRED